MPDAVHRLLATSDLHFHLHPEGDAATAELAAFVCESDCDAFAIAGDVGGAHPKDFEQCLQLFAGFKGLKLLVPGNHDLWTSTGDSLRKYCNVLPRLTRKCGFHYLDSRPLVAGSVGFIGNIGWYDYSFRNPRIGLTVADYRRKAVPGLCTWNDRDYIRWRLDDAQFTERCLGRLRRHHRSVEPQVEQVVCVLHHVPFAELLYGPADAALEFCRAYLGSEQFGLLLVGCPKVRYVICGHRHGQASCEQGNLKAFVTGSDYARKRLLEIDLASGQHQSREFAAG